MLDRFVRPSRASPQEALPSSDWQQSDLGIPATGPRKNLITLTDPTTSIMENRHEYRLDSVSLRHLATVLVLRSVAYDDPSLKRPELADLFSRHYVWRGPSGEIVAALRVGYTSFEEHLPSRSLPEWFNSEFMRGMVVRSRFFTTSPISNGLQVAKGFFGAIWNTELDRDTRANACIVRAELIPFYLRLGYFYISNTGHFDVLGRKSCVMLSPANPAYDSPFAPMFSDIDRPRVVDPYLATGQLVRSYKQIKELLDTETGKWNQ